MSSRRALKSTATEKRSAGKTRKAAKATVRKREKRPIQTPATKKVSAESDEKIFRDDPVLDRRIIDGMLNDRHTLMSEMAKRGYGDAAVLRRAAELGLSEALIRQVRGVAADLAGERPGRNGAPPTLGARTCLCCDRIFLSTGPANRLCMRCRGGDAGLAQL